MSGNEELELRLDSLRRATEGLAPPPYLRARVMAQLKEEAAPGWATCLVGLVWPTTAALILFVLLAVAASWWSDVSLQRALKESWAAVAAAES